MAPEQRDQLRLVRVLVTQPQLHRLVLDHFRPNIPTHLAFNQLPDDFFRRIMAITTHNRDGLLEALWLEGFHQWKPGTLSPALEAELLETAWRQLGWAPLPNNDDDLLFHQVAVTDAQPWDRETPTPLQQLWLDHLQAAEEAGDLEDRPTTYPTTVGGLLSREVGIRLLVEMAGGTAPESLIECHLVGQILRGCHQQIFTPEEGQDSHRWVTLAELPPNLLEVALEQGLLRQLRELEALGQLSPELATQLNSLPDFS